MIHAFGTAQGWLSLSSLLEKYKRNVFTFIVTTTGAQTLTLQALDVIAGQTITVYWGDGSSNAYTGSGTRTHNYAGAGTWIVEISNSQAITNIDFRDSKILFNSSTLKSCGSNLTGIYLSGLANNCVINSADMAHLSLSYQLHLLFTQAGTYAIDSSHFAAYTLTLQLILNFPQAGTYAIDSSHFAAYTLTFQLYLYFPQAGTYAIDSSHFAAYTLTFQLYLHFPQAGTYTINSSHFSAYTLSYRLYLHFTQAGTYTINSSHFAAYTLSYQLILLFHIASVTSTINRTDFDAFPALPTVQIEMGLTQAKVDAILLGFYDGFPAKTVLNGTIDLLGNGNAAPSGILQAMCPPTTGKEAAYELVNDSCGISTKHWASITTA